MEEIKKCSKCGERKVRSDDKNVSQFHRRPNGKWYSHCKECQNKYTAAHYQVNKENYIAKARKHDIKYQETVYAWLFEFFKKHPCIDCGEKNPIVLEFDHRDGEKKEREVSTLVNSGCRLATIQQEVAKCDVRCSNCHKKRTAIQRNWYWIKFLKKLGSIGNWTVALATNEKECRFESY